MRATPARPEKSNATDPVPVSFASGADDQANAITRLSGDVDMASPSAAVRPTVSKGRIRVPQCQTVLHSGT